MSAPPLSGFLAAFFPDEHEEMRLRLFKPKKAPDTPDNRPRKFSTTPLALAHTAALQGQLRQLNATRGLYFVVNSGGDEDEQITRFNAWFAEDDGRTIAEQHARLDAGPLAPSIRVETRQSVHAYWLTAGECGADAWRDMQCRLIAHFGGDDKIKNPSRVMRLPYFNHVHYDKKTGALSFKPVEIAEFAPERRYTLAEMQAAFAPVCEPEPTPEPAAGQAEQSADGFASWDELNAETARRIRLSAKAKTDRKGWTHAPGICHGSHEGKALYVSPDGAYGCLNKCTTTAIRAAHGLPERPQTAEPEHTADSQAGKAESDSAPLRVVRMADVAPEQVSWLWYPYIPHGKFTLLEGDPGLGKSWITCALACAVSRGRGLPNAEPFAAGNVLMLSAEDGLGDTLRPRLDAVGADVSRVFALDEPLTFDGPGLLRLEAAIIEHSPVLVTVDPLFAFTGAKTDIHRANECRAISAPLAAIAERQGCALVAVRHLGKSHGGGHALNAGIGSIDFTAAARSVLLAGRDPDDESKRAVVHVKHNLTPKGAAIGYKIEGSQFFWTGASDLTAERILATSSDGQGDALVDSLDFLRNALADGEREVLDVEREARHHGITHKTLRRAREQLGIRARRVGAVGSKQKFYWSLPTPDDAHRAPDDAQEEKFGHHRGNEASKGSYDNNLPDDTLVSEFGHHREETRASSAAGDPLSDEEAELAAHLEYYGAPSGEAEATARRMFQDVPF